jgi:hypothetical protein
LTRNLVIDVCASPTRTSSRNVNEPKTPSSSRIHRVLLALILLYPVPFMFQGLDWTDLGFLVSNYQQVFRHPASIAFSFTCWLTVVIGGAWMWITSPLGLLGAKLGYVVVSGLTMFITYVTLRRAFRGSETAILGALFVAATCVYYDEFGAMRDAGLGKICRRASGLVRRARYRCQSQVRPRCRRHRPSEHWGGPVRR